MEQPIERVDFSERPQDDGLRFAQRMHRLRKLGLALGAVCVGGALWEQGAHAPAWAALLVNALAWPHIAYPLARRSGNPYRAELRNLMVDSASGGAWIAAIGFSPAPSAVIFAMMAMDKVSVGGLRFLARCLAAQVGAAAVVAMALGFEVHPLSSTVERLAGLRLHDVAGRYGGEEFGVVLPGTTVQGAELLAERIRAGIESAMLEPRNAVRATVSLGVAAFDARDAGHMEWIARADRALYSAKESGRNRTAHYAAAGG